MPVPKPRFLSCDHCGQIFERPSQRGRPPRFCGKDCRSTAERVRTSPRPVAAHDFDKYVLRATEQVLHQLQRVRKVAKEADPSNWYPGQSEPEIGASAVLEEVQALQNEVDTLMAVSVLQAREWRMTLAQIGGITGDGTNQARVKYAKDKVLRTWNRRHELREAARSRSRNRRPRVARQVPAASEAAPEAPTSKPVEYGPEEQLRMALSYLHRTSGRSMRSLAKEIGVSPSYVARLVSGERIPPWDVAAGMAQACGGSAAQVQPLWDEIHGRRPDRPVFPRQQGAAAQAVAELKDAIHGLYLAGACPAPEVVAGRGPAGLTADQVASLVERGHDVDIPKWDVVEHVVTALRGRPDVIRPLWERVQVAKDAHWTPTAAAG